MSGFDTLRYEKRDGIVVVALCRPDVINAFNVRMRDELYEVLSAARDDAEVRGLLIAGDGERGFCAGADLTEFGSAPSQAVARYVRWARDIWSALAELPKPTMAAVHGCCFGSGLEIAALCDLRIASQDAVFALPEASLGLIPAAGGTQSLPRIVGLPRAMELALTGRRMTTSEAVRAGFVDWLVPREQLKIVAEARLREVASAPAGALGLAKRAVNEGADLTLAEGLLLERRLAARLR